MSGVIEWSLGALALDFPGTINLEQQLSSRLFPSEWMATRWSPTTVGVTAALFTLSYTVTINIQNGRQDKVTWFSTQMPAKSNTTFVVL